jgi:hypothetical protein
MWLQRNVVGLAGAICHAIAIKLMRDEGFQAELMGMVEGEGVIGKIIIW